MKLTINLEARKAADAIANSPGFWPEPHTPTPLAKAIQMPLADPAWQSRVLAGYAATKLYRREALKAAQ